MSRIPEQHESEQAQSSSPEQATPPDFAPIIRTGTDESLSTERAVHTVPTSYGTMSSSTEVPSEESGRMEGPSNHSRNTHNRSPNSSAPSSSQPDRSRVPSMMRRMSSRRPGPHRGQGFSVDDNPEEVEQDQALQQVSIPVTSPHIRPLKNRSSTVRLRRRTAAQGDTLSRKSTKASGEEDWRLPDSYHDHFGESSGDQPEENEDAEVDDIDVDDEVSDAESFTLKDRQQAINETHPFGIRIWKPALYKKSRSVEKTAEGDIHSSPGGRVSKLLFLVNLLWTLFFGWWLALAALACAIACFLCALSSPAFHYGSIYLGLSRYVFYPFGSFVRLESDELYAEEDEGEGRSISEYEQWQSGDIEHGGLFFGPANSRSLIGRRRNSIDSASEQDSLLGRTGRGHYHTDNNGTRSKRRLFGRGKWSLGRVLFYTLFYLFMGPLMLFVSLICWMLVFWIPMGRVMNILVDHLRRHPLAVSFHSATAYTRPPSTSSSSILLCTYRAAGLRYWKYTIDGTNIFFINLLALVVFAIFDYWVLDRVLGLDSWLTHPGFIFTLALLSVIPLAYFIGQAVASISAQSSMGLGAAVNAFFSTIVEVYLYCVALTEGKAQLVEGSVIGSIFAGVLFLPGLSMCFGAIKRKTQRFNVKSAGVTSNMLLFAVIAAFGPTLFYQIYGSHELNCRACVHFSDPGHQDCRRCYFSQTPAIHDQFFLKAVQPYSWFAAFFLFLSYVIGLWFTLRTHAAVIWTTEADEKKTPHAMMDSITTDLRQVTGSNGPFSTSADSTAKTSIRDSQLYRRILGQSLGQVGLSNEYWEETEGVSGIGAVPRHLVPPQSAHRSPYPGIKVRGLSDEENENLVRQVAEVAATAVAAAARDVTRSQRRTSASAQASSSKQDHRPSNSRSATATEGAEEVGHVVEASHAAAGGHDAPNWSKMKSSIVLLVATLAYAVIAEILVNTVDVVLDSVDIDEKFLGITLFALVPNTTEFLNAISFAMNGNIALSMEIGSAYALQVCLLQIPALVLFSAIYAHFSSSEALNHTFNLIFPQWDMVTVILCVFLLSYVYSEGKSNYFKGSILVLTYLVVVIGFYLSGYNNLDTMGIDRFDKLALGNGGPEKFYTIGRTMSGVAYG